MYGYDASLNVKNSFPVFSTHIEANFVSKREDIYSVHALTDDDKARVIELSRDPRIGERQGGRAEGREGGREGGRGGRARRAFTSGWFGWQFREAGVGWRCCWGYCV